MVVFKQILNIGFTETNVNEVKNSCYNLLQKIFSFTPLATNHSLRNQNEYN